jgi:tetratricopeptide (TPR) repeat protein
LEISRQLGDQRGIASALGNIATIRHNKGEYDQAMDLYNQSLEISMQLGDLERIAFALNNIGLIHDIKGEYDEALSYVLQAYEILERLKSPDLQRSVFILGIIKDKLGSEAFERLIGKDEVKI